MSGKRRYSTKEYADYVHRYKAQKRYRVKIGDTNYAPMLSERDYKEYSDTMTNKDIVYNQFHFYDRDTAHKIQNSLKQEGFDLSISKIQARDYTEDIYKKIKNTYADLRLNMSARDAAALISYTFYGS